MVDKVRQLYADGLSQGEVADALGTTQKVVWTLMRRHDIPRRPPIARSPLRGRDHPSFNPSSTNYATLHGRVEAARGRPSECAACGSTSPDERYEWANLTGDYQSVDDFARMCVPCHRRFDAGRRSKAGGATAGRFQR